MKDIKNRERARVWYQTNKDRPEVKADRQRRLSIWRKEHPREYLHQRAKQRARLRNVKFDITFEDIHIPEICPILKVPLKSGTRYAPSLDRVNSNEGYCKGNIQVISRKANMMKQDASLEELKNFAEWANQLLHL